MTLLKWIVCQVPPELRNAFDQAQQQWQRLAAAAGFLGQIGGWDQRDPTQACILALWRDRAAYDRFMAQLHDDIVAQSDQRRTYTAIHVSMAEVLFPMPGAAPELGGALAMGNVLRVADCQVHSAQIDHFVTVQQQVWLSAMDPSDGMLGGCVSRTSVEDTHYLVTTLWDTMANHERYVVNQVPTLRTQAAVNDELMTLTGYVVALAPQWSVLPAVGPR